VLGRKSLLSSSRRTLVRFWISHAHKAPTIPPRSLSLAFGEVQVALDADRPAGSLARKALQLAESVGEPDLVTEAQMLLLEAEPPAQTLAEEAGSLATLAGPRRARPLATLRLLSATARTLAERGETEAARPFFTQAQRLLNEVAAGIADNDVRERFVARFGANLLAALRAQGNEPPLFANLERPPILRSRLVGILWGVFAVMLLALKLGVAPAGIPSRSEQAVILTVAILFVAAMGTVRSITRRRDAESVSATLLGVLLNFWVIIALLLEAAPQKS
jgi:hypothetical protein